ncbi:unnamed protein product [Acanthoscelides obtectus]|uniref:RING-type E3 ubiquitin transferase n=1 Tax=Acanthoscelides obtectus TaxID=200917 RepID=A0A9P0LUE3_ACAOB|nr:unnamed protein product [Acanthoscelides obtectus]CAK1670168.1 E3 ubiquitin-protein ligase SIAH1 [Acanthoscelides obtectus]
MDSSSAASSSQMDLSPTSTSRTEHDVAVDNESSSTTPTELDRSENNLDETESVLYDRFLELSINTYNQTGSSQHIPVYNFDNQHNSAYQTETVTVIGLDDNSTSGSETDIEIPTINQRTIASQTEPQITSETADGSELELNTYQRFLQLLECPVCYNYMSPPFGQCSHGHVICPRCYDLLSRCPICRSPKISAHPVVIERIYDVTPLPCKFEPRGCKLLIKGKYLKRHEERCKFKPWTCPLQPMNCHWEGDRHDLLTHLQQMHPGRIILNDSRSFYCRSVIGTNSLFMMVLFYTDDTLFRAFWQFDGTQSLMKFCVCQMQREITEEDFFYSFTLFSLSTREESVKLMAKCYIPDNLEHDLFISNQFVAVHFDLLRKYSNEKGDVKIRIQIIKQYPVISTNSLETSLSIENNMQA